LTAFFSVVGFLAGWLFLAAPAVAQLDPGNGTSEETLAALERFLGEGINAGFEYRREGRPDPFFPFLTEEILQAEAAAREELTGMRKFEPGQLTLVAIVFTERGPVAMVQDSAGVGYIIRKGTKIGRNGEVKEIIPNKVIIEQQTFSLSRQKRFRTVEMVLKKEGDRKQ